MSGRDAGVLLSGVRQPEGGPYASGVRALGGHERHLTRDQGFQIPEDRFP
ncbi:MAG TPA: hypothetical protein VLR91_02950 [Thermodesulfobacteriota bacterium]|nr:hypothetical protein [Thermodesulfobacteriota bacterium]